MRSFQRKVFWTKEERLRYRTELAQRNIQIGTFLTALISVFEVILMLYTVMQGFPLPEYKRNYFICYCFLLIISLVALVLSCVFHRQKCRNFLAVEITLSSYLVLIMLWSVMISVLDSQVYYNPTVLITVLLGAANAVIVDRKVLIPTLLISPVLYACGVLALNNSSYGNEQLLNVAVAATIAILVSFFHGDWFYRTFQQKLEIEKINGRLLLLSETDALTRVKNRLCFDRDFGALFTRSLNAHETATCAILDVDNFKSINDTFGHSSGDEILKKVANTLAAAEQHSVYRVGGEEFAVISSGKEAQDEKQMLDDLLRRISLLRLDSDPDLHVTASFGFLCRVPRSEDKADMFFSYADKALYCAKAAGKNCVKEYAGEQE